MIEDCRQSRAERGPGDTRQVGGNEGIGHDVKPVYLLLKGFESGCRATNAANSSPPAAGVTAPKNPMAGSLPACCARAASGHAAAAEQRDERAPFHAKHGDFLPFQMTPPTP